jgi:CubicO group peptidase (beta-lactamase class C family)
LRYNLSIKADLVKGWTKAFAAGPRKKGFAMRVILMSLLVLLTFGSAGQAALADNIDTYIQTYMKRRQVPGVSIAIVQDGRLSRAKGYGLANVELAAPATANTVYQLASVTKQFTATAIMMLVEEGKLSVDDRITKLLPDLPTAWEPVTVRHLLNHTSGIKSYTSTKDFDKVARKDFGQRELLDLVAHESLEFTPGEKWNYSNTGYFLLGMLIEKISGKPFGAFLDERIFKPLGMAHTRVNNLRAIVRNRAQGYTVDGPNLRNGEYVSPTQPFAAGALLSTVTDLVKWDAALNSDRLLKRPTLEQMWKATALTGGTSAPYGFGWQIETVNGHRCIAHGGGIDGFSTFIARYVDDGLTVVVLTNSDHGDAGRLAQGIAGRVLPVLARKPEAAIADLDPQTTERLRRMILSTIKGDADLDLFSEPAKPIRAAHIKEEQADMAQHGPLKTFHLLESRSIEQGSVRRYRAVFEKETLMMFFQLDNAGKINGMRIAPED